jgi:hypothetical protein
MRLLLLLGLLALASAGKRFSNAVHGACGPSKPVAAGAPPPQGAWRRLRGVARSRCCLDASRPASLPNLLLRLLLA